MQSHRLAKSTLVLAAVWLVASTSIWAQENRTLAPPQTEVASPYPNAKQGLQQLLQDVRSAANSADAEKVMAFLRDTEIPNCGAWLHTMYESSKADSWMGLCDPKQLAKNEGLMQELFARLAKGDGEFLIRKVNDNPERTESGWLQAIRRPLDIYFASWKSSNQPSDSKGDPIGYFMFIENGFRWESGIWFPKAPDHHPTFVPPKLIKQVNPVYPPEADALHIRGTVRVSYVVGPDGAVHNAHAISGEGLSDDPSLRKAAEEAVTRWSYEPATLDGNPAQMDNMTADVVFAAKP